MNETTKLDLNFLTEEGKKKKITLNSPKAELTEEEVTQAMDAIVDSKLCENQMLIDKIDKYLKLAAVVEENLELME